MFFFPFWSSKSSNFFSLYGSDRANSINLSLNSLSLSFVFFTLLLSPSNEWGFLNFLLSYFSVSTIISTSSFFKLLFLCWDFSIFYFKKVCNWSVLGPQGCHNNVPKTGWFKTTEIYHITVLGAWSLKSRCQQGHAPCKLVGENASFLPPSSWWLLLILAIPWFAAAALQSQPLLSHGILPSCVSLEGHQSYLIKGTGLQDDLILTNYICNDPISKFCHILRYDYNICLGRIQFNQKHYQRLYFHHLNAFELKTCFMAQNMSCLSWNLKRMCVWGCWVKCGINVTWDVLVDSSVQVSEVLYWFSVYLIISYWDRSVELFPRCCCCLVTQSCLTILRLHGL